MEVRSVLHTRPDAIVRPASDVLIDSGCGDLGAEIVASLERHRPLRLDVERYVRDFGASGLARTTVLFVGARTLSGTSMTRLIRRIRSLDPRIVINVCEHPGERDHHDICAYANVGADDLLVLASPSDRRQLVKNVSTRMQAPPPEDELQVLAGWVAGSTHGVLALHLVRNAVGRSEHDCAATFGISVQTIHNRLHAMSLPSGGALRRCGVQFHAMELRRRAIRSREQVARRVGLTGAGALARQRRDLVRALSGDVSRGARLLGLLA